MVRSRKQKKSMRKRRKTMKGGVSFNSSMNFNDIPKSDYYGLNTYIDDVSNKPFITDARLLGGTKMRRKSRKSRKSKKMKGGSTFLTIDPILGGSASVTSSNMLSLNQIPGYSGASNISNVINGGNISSSGPSLAYTSVNNALV